MLRIKSLDQILATAEKKPLHRSLGAFQLTMLGIGSVIGTGIFVLTSEAAQKAGPGMMLSFVIAASVCVVAALCYAELAAMVPVAGSAYTYSYAVLGEFVAWLVGWALILEYAVAASAVAVGWSGYVVGLLAHLPTPIVIPVALTQGPYAGGLLNLPAVIVSLLITWLLVVGTKESATINSILVVIKMAALVAFCIFAIPVMHMHNFHPFNPLGTPGIVGAAASIFFAYVGFDAVSTAAEETRDPQRNLPIGVIASLAVCTLLYLLVAAGAIGSYGAQPLFGLHGEILSPGTTELAARCAQVSIAKMPLVCSSEALAHVLRQINHPIVGNLLGLAAGLALPSVILTMIYGQTRIFFVMSRDGLLPEVLSTVHKKYRTPHIITIITGIGVAIGAAFFPVGQLSDISNSGTLFAFLMVAVAVMVLRVKAPTRHRPFRTPLVWIIAPLAVMGCLILFFFLPPKAQLLFPIWSGIGLVFYFAYGFRHSHVARGLDITLDEKLPE
jgi:APA family basic amino acid/polyamine antiporter